MQVNNIKIGFPFGDPIFILSKGDQNDCNNVEDSSQQIPHSPEQLEKSSVREYFSPAVPIAADNEKACCDSQEAHHQEILRKEAVGEISA